MTSPIDLSVFCDPSSVAVVGASSSTTKMGGASIRNLRHFGYGGTIYAVNGKPSQPELGEYSSLRGLPTRPDAVVIAVPADAAIAALEDAIDLEVPAVIMVSAGFGEGAGGPVGKERAKRLEELVHSSGTRVLGPNTAGLADFTHQFVPRAVLNSPDDINAGPVAIVSQSGALSNTLLARLHQHGLGVGLCVATGDESDLRFDHWLSYVADRDDLSTVVWVVEGVRNGRATDDALHRLHVAGKQVITLQVGGSVRGQTVAATHTGALACEADVLKELCRQHGAVVANGIDDACRLAVLDRAFGSSGEPSNPMRAMLVCGSGGEAAMLADAYSEANVELPQPSKRFRAFVDERFSFAEAANPFDLTGQTLSTAGLLVDTLTEAMNEDVDLVHLALPVFGDELGDWLYADLDRAFAGRHKVPLLVTLWTSRGFTDRSWRTWLATSAAVLDGSDGVASAVRRLADAKRVRPRKPARAEQISAAETRSLSLIESHVAARGIATTSDARDIAPSLNMFVPECISAEVFEAQMPPGRFWVKGYTPGVVHKKAAGLVMGPFNDPHSVNAALADGVRQWPKAEWVAERSAEGEIALMVSVRRDNLLGSAILIGPGGGLTELFSDAISTVLPVSDVASVIEALRPTKLGQYIEAEAYDSTNAFQLIFKILSSLRRYAGALTERFELVEFNPIFIDSEAGRAWCVDFVVTQ